MRRSALFTGDGGGIGAAPLPNTGLNRADSSGFRSWARNGCELHAIMPGENIRGVGARMKSARVRVCKHGAEKWGEKKKTGSR